MPEFNYVDPMDGLIKGQNFVNGLFDHAATLQAGRAYQKGDVRGAAGILASRGDFKQADALSSQATTTDALTAASSGDYAGARAAAAKGGDAALYGQTTAAEQQDRTQRLEWMGHATDAMLQIPAERRPQAFQQLAPTLKAMGVPDDQIAQMGSPEKLSDESLNAFKTTIGQMGALDIQKTEDGTIVGIDKRTGSVKVLHQGQVKGVIAGPDLLNPYTGEVMHQGDRTKYMTVTNDDGTTSIVPVGGGAGGSAASGAAANAPAPTGGVYDKMAALAEQKGATPEEQAYLRHTLKIESHGDPNAQNGSSTGMFQFHPDTFKSVLPGGNINDPNDQVQATLNLARRDQARLQKLGVDPTPGNTYIMHQQGPAGGPALLTAPPDVNAISALTPAYGGNAKKARLAILGNGGTEDMTAGEFVDHWRAKFGEGAASQSSGAQMGKPIATGSHSGTMRWKQLADGRQQDTRTGKIEGTKDPSADAGIPGNPNLTGEAYLQSLPQEQRNMVKMMVTGRMAPPSSFALGKPYWQGMLQAAATYDPSFDQTTWAERKKSAADYSPGGKAGQNITALNTAIGHLGHLYDQVGNLHNMGGMMTPLNGLINTANTATGWTGAKTFEQTKEAVTDEAIRVFKQSGGNMEEAKRWADSLKSSDAPGQLYANVKNLAELLKSRIDANADTYKRTMGPNAPPIQFVSPSAQATLAKIQGMGKAVRRAKPKTSGDGWRIVE